MITTNIIDTITSDIITADTIMRDTMIITITFCFTIPVLLGSVFLFYFIYFSCYCFYRPFYIFPCELYIYIYHHYHHQVVPPARISLTLSRHFSRSFIASGRSSRLHPVSSHSCCMYVRSGHPAFAWPYVGVHRGTSLISSSLLLQQCPACLVRLTCIVFVIGGRWPYSWCLVGCCGQDLFNIARNILV